MTKIKINIGSKELSGKEIEQGKNFQALLKKFEQIKVPFYRRPWFIVSSGIVIVALTYLILTSKISQQGQDHNIEKKTIEKKTNSSHSPLPTPGIPNTTDQSISTKSKPQNTSSKTPEAKQKKILSNPNTNEAERMKEMASLEYQIDSLKNQFQKLNHNLPIEPKKARQSGSTFNIDVLPEEFPELSIYKDVVFELEEEKKDQFKELTSIDWEKGELKDNVKGLNYLMVLQKGKDVKKFVVYPVYQGKSYEDAVYQYHKFLHELDELRAQIETKENKLKDINR